MPKKITRKPKLILKTYKSQHSIHDLMNVLQNSIKLKSVNLLIFFFLRKPLDHFIISPYYAMQLLKKKNVKSIDIIKRHLQHNHNNRQK